MLHHLENTNTIMTMISQKIIHRLEEAKEGGEKEMSIADLKKCMDITRDISDSAIKLVKNERAIDDHKATDCVLVEKQSQEVYSLLQELKQNFTPKVLNDIMEMNEDEAMAIISDVVEKVTNENDSKIKRRDYKTKAEYKRAKYIQNIIMKQNDTSIAAKARARYAAWFKEMNGEDSKLVYANCSESEIQESKMYASQFSASRMHAGEIDASEVDAIETNIDEDCANWNKYQNDFNNRNIDCDEVPSFYS